MSDSKVEIDKKTVERLKRLIVTKENINLKKREKSDQNMVKSIMKLIEEETQCYLKR